VTDWLVSRCGSAQSLNLSGSMQLKRGDCAGDQQLRPPTLHQGRFTAATHQRLSIGCLSEVRSYVKEISSRNRYNIHRRAATIAYFITELVLFSFMSSSSWVMFWDQSMRIFKRNEILLTSRSFRCVIVVRVLSKPASTASQLFYVQSFIATRNQW
jgi:hypothetical protein